MKTEGFRFVSEIIEKLDAVNREALYLIIGRYADMSHGEYIENVADAIGETDRNTIEETYTIATMCIALLNEHAEKD